MKQWPVVRLEELVTKVGSGATPKGGEAKYKAAGTPLIRSMNVVFFGFKREGLAYLDDEQAAGLKNVEVCAGDVLLNITGASIGRVTQAPNDMDGARVNQHVCIIRTNEFMESRFLSAYLSSPEMQDQIWADNYGVTRQALTKQQILNFEVPVPSLNEQRRIADKLDQTLAIVERALERLRRVPEILNRFRQSVLAAATDGRLTEDWRAEQTARMQPEAESSHCVRDSAELSYRVSTTPDSDLNSGISTEATPASWVEETLMELCHQGRVITYGVIKLGDEIPNGVPCLRTSNVRWLRIDIEGIKRIAASLSKEYGRTVLKGGEVLVNVRGTLGGVAVVSTEMVGWNVSREVAVVPCDPDRVSAYFLAFWIASEKAQRWLSHVEKGVAYTGINIEDLRNLPVNVPPSDEQTEIVRRVEALFALADRIEARHQAALARVEKLTQALLAKAFRGELVPQDPNDEPASMLLERIRAARELKVPTESRRRSSRMKEVRA